MNTNDRFHAWALASPWAMDRDHLRAHAAVLARRLAARIDVNVSAPAAPAAAAEPQAAAPRAAFGRAGAIAVVPLQGTIMQHAGMVEMCGGGTSVDTFMRAFREAMADDTVGQLLIEIDSPGGSVFGVQEAADEIRAARATKPVVAVANSMAASAAYWIGCAAGELYCTPSGQVGSIGVYAAHEDWSRALEEAGITTTLISAGKFKTEGNPYQPLGEEARAAMQADVDGYYADFTKAVAKGRNVPIEQVRTGMGQGRVLRSGPALEAQMVDGVMTRDEVIRTMQRRAAASKTNTGRAARLARDRELDTLA